MFDFVTLGDNITIQKGKAPLLTGYSDSGAKPYLNPEYLRGRGSAELARPGSDSVHASDEDTILLWDGSNAGEFFRAKYGLVASTMAKVTPNSRFNTTYFFHVTKHAETYLKSQTNGTGIPHVDRELLEAIRVFCPVPLEQLRLAQILDTLDTAIVQTEAIIAKLKAVKQGLLHDLLTRGIDTNGELRPTQVEAPQLYKESPLGWIPREWEVAALVDLSESLVDGPFGSNLKTAHYVENPGVRVVRLQNILQDEYDDSERAFVSERHAASLSKNRVVGGDVLIASLGDYNYPVGRSCCYPAELPDAVNKADCFRFRANARCQNEFVMHSLNGATARKQARSYEQGVTMKRINLGNLRRIGIKLPSKFEQALIVERMVAARQRLEVTGLEYVKLWSEKSGLMDDLLTGRVRVTPLLAAAS